jgi:hypothetical protein
MDSRLATTSPCCKADIMIGIPLIDVLLGVLLSCIDFHIDLRARSERSSKDDFKDDERDKRLELYSSRGWW